MTKKQERLRRLERHLRACAALAGLYGLQKSATEVHAALQAWERRAHRLSTAYCNGDTTTDGWDLGCERIKNEIKAFFGQLPKGFFINGDARGYALKLQEGSLPIDFERDWGGYQILAPDFGDA